MLRNGEQGVFPMLQRVGLASLVVWGCLAGSTIGCLHDTSYLPKRPGAYLVISDNQYRVAVRDTIQKRTEMSNAFQCDGDAANFAEAGEKAAQAAERNGNISGMMSALTPLVPVLAFVGLPFAIVAANAERRSLAHTIDALNRFNDVTTCVGPVEDRP